MVNHDVMTHMCGCGRQRRVCARAPGAVRASERACGLYDDMMSVVACAREHSPSLDKLVLHK